jgi:hypothetical protein
MSEAPWPAASYKLNQRAYMPRSPGFDHDVLEEGTTVLWDGKPGPHMDPLDDTARAAKERAGEMTLDWTQYMPLNGDATDEDMMTSKIIRIMAGVMAKQNAAPAPITAPAPVLSTAPPAPPLPKK